MASSNRPELPQRRKSLTPPPMMRVLLVGKNMQENRRVGNFILGRNAFDTESPSQLLEQQTQEAIETENIKNRRISLNISHYLFDPELSVSELNERVSECMSLCDPGPHVIVLVLQRDDFTEEDRTRLNVIFCSLPEEAPNHTIVLTQSGSSVDPAKETLVSNEITAEFKKRHFDFTSRNTQTELVELMEKTIKINKEKFLKPKKAQKKAEKTTQRQVEHTVRPTTGPRGIWAFKDKVMGFFHGGKQEAEVSQRVNLVLCGYDENQKATISDFILGQSQDSPEPNLLCVKRNGEVSGRSVTLVGMPALSNVQEEDAKYKALHCVSLCDPGVYSFVYILPVGTLSDKDKGEMEKIQKIFSPRVKDNLIVLFTTKFEVCPPVTTMVEHDPEIQKFLATCDYRYKIVPTEMDRSSKQAELLDYVVKSIDAQMFSLDMYMMAQEERVRHEVEEVYKEKLSKKEEEIQELKWKLKTEGDENEAQVSSCLRVVLIGKTGNGKSATGNTILGKNEFETKLTMDSVTKVCQKGVSEVLGKSIAVVDTPGLCDALLSTKEVQEEIVKCISMSAPGPHAFIIVLPVGRLSKEDVDALDLIKRIFGPKAAMFSIVLFTRGDYLENQTINEYVETCKNESVRKLLKDCGDRFMVFNNREKQDRTQVSDLLILIEKVINSNTPSQFFTNNMFQEAEMSVKKKIEEILKEKEQEIEAEKEKLKTKYSLEMEQMKKRLEEEKQKADEEKLKIQQKEEEKMDALKKEFEEKGKMERTKREMEDKAREDEGRKQMQEWQKRIHMLEIENRKQTDELKKQLNDRDEEDKKREERYKQEKEHFQHQQNQAMEELRKRQMEDLKRRDSEEDRRRQKEEDERCDWERKIKEAEYERTEIQEDLKRKQRQWEEEKKRQIEQLQEEDRQRKQRHTKELQEKQEEQDRMRETFKRGMEEERLQREKEKRKWREESERKDREYEKKKRDLEAQMKEQYKDNERRRREEQERRNQEDEERRVEESRRLKEREEDIKRQWQEDIKKREAENIAREERGQKEREELKKRHDQEMKDMKNKYDDDARRQAEQHNEFNETKKKEFQELTEDFQKRYELLNNLYKLTEGQSSEEIKKLRTEIDKLKNESHCTIL